MKHIPWVVGVIVLIPAIIYVTRFANASPGTGRTNGLIALVLFLIALVLFGIFFFKHFRAEGDQDISITKF